MLNLSVRDKLIKVARTFFTTDTLPPFILGSIFLSVVGNSATQLLFNTFGTSTLSVLGIGLGAVLIFFLSMWLIAQRLNRPTVEVNQQRQAPQRKKGLILLVSRQEPCEKAIEYHAGTEADPGDLRKCWLIGSTQGQSRDCVGTLQKMLKDRGIDVIVSQPVADVFDPRMVYQEVLAIYRNIPNTWQVEDVIADFTGMTAPSSVGMVLACMSVGGELEYTPAQLDESGRPTTSLEPIAVTHRDLKTLPRLKP
jgi:hypothetical protein